MKQNIQLNADAIRFREKVGYSNREPIDIESVVLKMGDYTIVKLELPERISGMCIVDESSKLIAINSLQTLGRQRYSIAHELYHLEVEKLTEGTVCLSNGYDSKSDSEREAEQFASYLLMPYDGLEWYIEKYNVAEWDVKSIIELSQFYKMSYMSVLRRLLTEGKINATQFESLSKVSVRNEALKHGYDVALYYPASEDSAWITLGEYPRMLEEKRNILPESLFHQFCNEAFREDMKNNYYEGGEVVND